jgi:hypothetical protein
MNLLHCSHQKKSKMKNSATVHNISADGLLVIFGHFADNTIALMQWAHQQNINNIVVANVDTGWAAPEWQARVEIAQNFARSLGFKAVTLKAKASFSEMVLDRQQFPSQKFQWCAGFLKGLCLLEWLDEVDAFCEATMMLGSRRDDSRARQLLSEFIDSSEHYGERKVWYPLFDHSNVQRDQLVQAAGFECLYRRSLECEPCIHSDTRELANLSIDARQRLGELEVKTDATMFAQPIESLCASCPKSAKKITRTFPHAHEHGNPELENFDMGCGAPYVCGE